MRSLTIRVFRGGTASAWATHLSRCNTACQLLFQLLVLATLMPSTAAPAETSAAPAGRGTLSAEENVQQSDPSNFLGRMALLEAEAKKFFTGCAIIPAAMPKNRPPTVRGKCLGHTFSTEGLSIEAMMDMAEHPDGFCQFHKIGVGPSSSWSVRFCNYDGQPTARVDLKADPTAEQIGTPVKWEPRQGPEREATPQERRDGVTLTRLNREGISGAPTDDVALEIVSAIVNEHWQKCGNKYLATEYVEVRETLERIDSYRVIAGGSTATEFAGVNIRIESAEVGTAAKLNGIQWIGDVYVTSEAYREYMPQSLKKWGGSSWGSWRSGSGGTLLMTRLKNVSGVWKYSPTTSSGFTTAGQPGVHDLHMALKTFDGPKPLSCEKRPAL